MSSVVELAEVKRLEKAYSEHKQAEQYHVSEALRISYALMAAKVRLKLAREAEAPEAKLREMDQLNPVGTAMAAYEGRPLPVTVHGPCGKNHKNVEELQNCFTCSSIITGRIGLSR